ncbi:hypothetical protein GF312_19015 [Candidatus Poribacteria bacterium]|nr:hypothetical protein [Candidatus Poribacteria bacterium]
MYKLAPLKVYMLDRVQDDPQCLKRMERMLEAIGYNIGDVICIDRSNLSEIVTEIKGLWPPDTVPEDMPVSYTKPLVFTRMDLSEKKQDLNSIHNECPEGTPMSYIKNIFGHINPIINWHPHELDQKLNQVCWPTYNFGTMQGCPHGCLYCGDGSGGKFITITLNLEEYKEKVIGPTIEKYPWNKCFRMIGWGADLIPFEPEYGLFNLFTHKLAQYDNRYGHFHTASTNVEWIADLPHRDRLLGVWSTTCESVSQNIEQGAGKAIERFEAGRKCEDMGIPSRYKFKPMIPVSNWREEYSSIIQRGLKISKPESIGFCVLMWMDIDTLLKRIDKKLLDPAYIEAAKEASEDLKGVKIGPFPHKVRAEIYRFLIKEVRCWDKDTLLYISTESREMWDELKGELGQDPRTYVCGCSSVAVPGKKVFLSPGMKYSTYCPEPV